MFQLYYQFYTLHRSKAGILCWYAFYMHVSNPCLCIISMIPQYVSHYCHTLDADFWTIKWASSFDSISRKSLKWKTSYQHWNQVTTADPDLTQGSFHTKSTKKIFTLSDFFENWHTCWVHRETTPDQNLAYFDYSPLRYDRSIFEAIIYTSSFKQPWLCMCSV